MQNKKHYAAAVTAFVIWGFFSIPLRSLMAYSAGEILYFRILFSLLVLIGVVLTLRYKQFLSDLLMYKSLGKHERRQVVMLTLAGGFLLTINWLTFIYIVNHINIKTASFAYLICPVITAVLGYILIQENLTRLQWFAVGLCALSCVMMGMNSSLELGYSFLTAFTYALYLITQRKNQGFDRMVMLAIQVAFSFVILTCFFPALVDQVPVAGDFYVTIVVIAIVFTVIPLFLNLFALNKINSATIGILMYLNPLINFTVAFIVFGEEITSFQFAGYSIVVIALILFNITNFKKIQAVVSPSKV